MTPAPSLRLEPVLSFPREAQIGNTYLFTVDLRSSAAVEDWPYPRTEEVTVYCFVDASPLFKSAPVGEPAVVLHRYGGTYGPAQFLLTPEAVAGEGVIRVTLANGFGMPMGVIETGTIQVRERVEGALPKAVRMSTPRRETPSPDRADVSTDKLLIRTYLEKLREHLYRDGEIVILAGLLNEIGAKLDPPVECRFESGDPEGWQWFDASGPYRSPRGLVQVLEDEHWTHASAPQVRQGLLPYLPVLTTNYFQFELVSQPPGQEPQRVATYSLVKSLSELESTSEEAIAAEHAAPFLAFLRMALSYDGRGARDDYAIVVGGGRYEGFPFLANAFPDAQRVADWLTSSSGGALPPDHVTLLDSPTLEQIDQLIGALAGTEGSRRKGRRLYLYFAGYSIVARNSTLILTREASPSRVTGISVEFYVDFLARSATFEEIVDFEDCSVTIGFGPDRPPPFTLPDRPLPPALQFRLVGGERGDRGELTRLLLQGLEGAAANDKGEIDTDVLRAYIRQHARSARPLQADSSYIGSGRIVLRSGVKPPAPNETVISPAQSAPAIEPLPMWELNLDDEGNIDDPKSLAAIAYQLQQREITDVVIYVHGWNMDRTEALTRLRQFGACLDAAAPAVSPSVTQRFGVIGAIWPSKAWSGDDASEHAQLEPARALTDAEQKAFEAAVRSLEGKPEDAGSLKKLWGEVEGLGIRLGDKRVLNEPEPPHLQPTTGFLGGLGQSMMTAMRATSYYQMRQRAGVVGEKGLGPAIGRLNAILPSIRIHLVGNSIGARLAAYALKNLADTHTGGLPVQSLVMLQGMVSDQIFASTASGILSSAFMRVDGPVIVTYSTNDSSAGTVYGLLTRLSGRDVDVPGTISTLPALGATGAKGLPTIELQIGKPGSAYSFIKSKIYNVDASQVIRSHADVMTPEIGWLILSATRDTPENA